MKIPLKCEYCDEVSEDVELREDPFDSEIRDDHTEHSLCPECYRERAMEI